MRRRCLILMAVILMAALTGCSSTQQDNAGNANNPDKNSNATKEEKQGKQQKGALIDAAELLPKEDVEKILGMEIRNAGRKDNESLGMSGMVYYNEDREKGVWISCFQQSAVPEDSDFDVKKQYRENKESGAEFESIEEIEGLGDDAYYDKMSNDVSMLVGDYSFTVDDSLSDLYSDEQKELEIKMAKIAEENLKKKLEK